MKKTKSSEQGRRREKQRAMKGGSRGMKPRVSEKTKMEACRALCPGLNSVTPHDKSPRIHWDINKVSQSLSAAAAALTGDGWRCAEWRRAPCHALCSSPDHPSRFQTHTPLDACTGIHQGALRTTRSGKSSTSNKQTGIFNSDTQSLRLKARLAVCRGQLLELLLASQGQTTSCCIAHTPSYMLIQRPVGPLPRHVSPSGSPL